MTSEIGEGLVPGVLVGAGKLVETAVEGAHDVGDQVVGGFGIILNKNCLSFNNYFLLGIIITFTM